MKAIYLNLIMLILVFLLGCQEQSVFTTVEKKTIEKEVKEQFSEMVSALNQKDVDAWSQYYSKDNFVSTIVLTDYYAERSAWVDIITKYISMRESQHLELLQVRVSALSPDLALMTSEENTEMLLKGGENIRSKHVFTMIWKKEQNDWKVLHSHESWVENQTE